MLFGCQQNITLELPKYEPKVAVFCILRPDQLPVMYLNLSKSYYSYGDTSGGYNFIKNAIVVITDQTINISETLHLDSGYVSFPNYTYSWFYLGKHVPLIGHNYIANISYNGKMIKAETMVPMPVNVDHFDYAKAPNSYYYNYHIYFNDLKGQTNYYSVSQFLPAALGNEIFDDTGFISDVGLDGKQLEINTNSYDNQGFSYKPPFTHWFAINSATPEAGKYMIDVSTQASSSRDPLSQPVVIESNVNGGLGIFGAVTPSPEFYIEVK